MANNTFFTASKTQFARHSEMLAAGKLCYGCMVKTPLSPYTNETICPSHWRVDSSINVWRTTFGGQIVLLMYGLAGRLYVITNTWIAPKHIHSTIFIRTSLVVDRNFSILQSVHLSTTGIFHMCGTPSTLELQRSVTNVCRLPMGRNNADRGGIRTHYLWVRHHAP